jgi:uncharacterized Fe-S cluster protein YjdI
MEKDITKKYTNGEVTIVWKPGSCIHSKICWSTATGLPEVFNPKIRPWINMENAGTEKMIEHVKKCPSGALSFYMNGDEENNVTISNDTVVEPLANGPLMIYGNITVKDKVGNEIKKFKVTAFCRCGNSQNKPYCDGSHVKIGFSD